MNQIELRVGNLDCEHDAANIERGLAGFTGLTNLEIYPKSAKVAISYDPELTKPEAIKEKLEALSFPQQKGMEMVEQPKPWWKVPRGYPAELIDLDVGLFPVDISSD